MAKMAGTYENCVPPIAPDRASVPLSGKADGAMAGVEGAGGRESFAALLDIHLF